MAPKLKKLLQEGDFSVGDLVLVGSTHESGTVKFIGTAQFSPGEWVGVELDKPLGKNDGTVKNVRYFDCKPNHGVFVRKTALLRPKQAEVVVKGETEKEPTKTKGAKALMQGLKSGEVSKIVDKMEEDGIPPSPKAARNKDFKNSAAPNLTVKTSKAETPPSSPTKARSPKLMGKVDDQAAVALNDLRQAAEEHNPDALRKALMVAESKGVSAEELGSAHRILAFETQRVLCKEVDKLRNVVGGLAEVVFQTQDKAKAIEISAKDTSPGNWITDLIKRIEGRVWEGLEKKVEERIESTVRAVAREMVPTLTKSSGAQAKENRKRRFGDDARTAAATRIQSAWRRRMARLTLDADTLSFNRIVIAVRKRHEAWASIFDERCSNSKAGALVIEEFHIAVSEIHPRLTRGQTNILFKGYTSGTERSDIDLAGFVGICQAVAVGDREASEFADVNMETFQNLATAGGDEAALKIQCAQRQRAARAEVASRAEKKQGNLQTIGGDQVVKARKWKYSQEQAAVMIQRWMRRRIAGIKDDPLVLSVKKVKLRYAAWCRAYDEVCNNGSGLDEGSFEKALEIAIPCRLSAAQKRVVCQGYKEGARRDVVDLVGFCAIASAVMTGDEAAAEYADMNLYTFQELGEKQCG